MQELRDIAEKDEVKGKYFFLEADIKGLPWNLTTREKQYWRLVTLIFVAKLVKVLMCICI